MSGRRLVLLRHGRTDWNHVHRIQGQQDSRLDDAGHAGAKAVAPVLAELSPAALWCSDLTRARDTADYVAGATGLVPTVDARLREHALGERETMTHEEYAAAHPAEYAAFAAGDFDVVPGGEATTAVRARMLSALEDAVASVGPGECVVVVSHGAAIRVATAALLGWPDDPRRQLAPPENCAWAVLREQPDDGGGEPATGVPAGRWRLDAWNRVVPALGADPDFATTTATG